MYWKSPMMLISVNSDWLSSTQSILQADKLMSDITRRQLLTLTCPNVKLIESSCLFMQQELQDIIYAPF